MSHTKIEILLTGKVEPFYLYRLGEAAQALGVSRKTLERAIAAKKIRTVSLKDGSREQRIAHFELLRYVAEKYQWAGITLQELTRENVYVHRV